MSRPSAARRAHAAFAVVSTVVTGLLVAAGSQAQSRSDVVRLKGHVPAPSFASRAGAVAAAEPVDLALSLPLRNENELNALLTRMYTPGDPLYGQFLTPEEFQARFSPTEAQYEAVARFAQANGLTVTGRHPNRILLDVTGPAVSVERAFSTRLARFQARTGRIFRAPEVEPGVPAGLAGIINGVVGLDNLAVRRPHHLRKANTDEISPRAGTRLGTGPSGGLSPTDIKKAYNLSGTTLSGSGQVLALFQLDGYTSTDITAYEDQFGLPHVPLQNILIDSVSGAAGSGADEVTLDIELQIAMAPGANKIMIYEAPNTDAGVLDGYNQIAVDNVAKQASTSWGLAELQNSTSFLNSENTIFKQMAAQGQSIFAASGDNGAYDDGHNLSVDDPASQPYVTGVGGTKLTTSSTGAWQSETTWNDGSAANGGSGGGISAVWSQPTYQSGVVSTASKGSTTQRNVPDVALNAEPSTGYSIYFGGKWVVYGGTSCAAPLWSGFTALVNQQRATLGKATIGFMNPTLYTLGKGANGATDFHDIADGSTNLLYPAVTGYDCATGWGTINGTALLADLSGGSTTTYTISGTVTSNSTGLAGVTLSAGGKTATTASDGTYTLSGLAAGTYTVTPSISGFALTPTSRSVTVGPNATGIDFTASSTVFSISGTVTLNGSGFSGVTVSAGGISTTTSSTGAYTLTGLGAGTYSVTATKSGYTFTPASQSVTLGPSQLSVNFTATAIPTYSISGTVTDGSTGIAGATVSGGGKTATTAGDGSYTLSGLVAGTYTVTASASGYSFTPSSRSVTLGPNATGINFTAVRSTFTVSGTVTLNGAGGLSGVTVSTQGFSTTTGADGSYSLSGLSSGSHTLTATKSGYNFTPSSQTVTLSADQIGVNFTASAATFSISGTVTQNGKGLSGATVSIGTSSTSTDSSGSYTLGGLSAGTYTVTVSQSGLSFSPSSRTVTVGPSMVGVNFTAAALLQLGGRITVGSAALSGVTVTAGGSSVVTDGKGNYTITGLTAGTYTVTPSLAGYAFSPTSRTVSLMSASLSTVNFTATKTATLLSFTLSKSSVVNGKSVTGTVRLTTKATADLNVGFFNNNTLAASVPGSVLIKRGKTSATIKIVTLKVPATTTVSITATGAGTSRQATLQVQSR